jgi:hypothetical protein
VELSDFQRVSRVYHEISHQFAPALRLVVFHLWDLLLSGRVPEHLCFGTARLTAGTEISNVIYQDRYASGNSNQS